MCAESGECHEIAACLDSAAPCRSFPVISSSWHPHDLYPTLFRLTQHAACSHHHAAKQLGAWRLTRTQHMASPAKCKANSRSSRHVVISPQERPGAPAGSPCRFSTWRGSQAPKGDGGAQRTRIAMAGSQDGRHHARSAAATARDRRHVSSDVAVSRRSVYLRDPGPVGQPQAQPTRTTVRAVGLYPAASTTSTATTREAWPSTTRPAGSRRTTTVVRARAPSMKRAEPTSVRPTRRRTLPVRPSPRPSRTSRTA